MFGKLVTFIAILAVAYGDLNVACRESSLRPITDFDIERYSGKDWYFIVRGTDHPELVNPPTTKCESETFASTAAHNTYRVNAQAVLLENGRNVSESVLVNVEESDPAIMHLDGANYTAILLGTDYESWSLTYACSVDEDRTWEYATIRSGSRMIDRDVSDFLESWIIGLGFSRESFIYEDQTGC